MSSKTPARAGSRLLRDCKNICVTAYHRYLVGADKLTARLVPFSTNAQLILLRHISRTQRQVVSGIHKVLPKSNAARDSIDCGQQGGSSKTRARTDFPAFFVPDLVPKPRSFTVTQKHLTRQKSSAKRTLWLSSVTLNCGISSLKIRVSVVDRLRSALADLRPRCARAASLS